MKMEIVEAGYRKAHGPYTRWLLSSDPFPIDADEISLFTRKDALKRCLLQNCVLGIDYITSWERVVTSTGATSRENIRLSILCFKELLMTQRSAKGKQVRRYFLLAEEVLRRDLLQSPTLMRTVTDRYQAYDSIVDELIAIEATQIKKNEAYYQSVLEHEYAAELLPRSCEHGQIDIHLSGAIIELKHWRDYKHALGQVLAYNEDREKETKVAFFGSVPQDSDICRIRELLSKYGVRMLYFDRDDKLCQVSSDRLFTSLTGCPM